MLIEPVIYLLEGFTNIKDPGLNTVSIRYFEEKLLLHYCFVLDELLGSTKRVSVT